MKTGISQEMRDIVISRLMAIPSNLRLSIGGGTFSNKELVEHVLKNDDIGQRIVDLQTSYLRSLKERYS